MNQIKGTLFLEYARIIRANKDRDWKKYLSEQDLKMIFGEILANHWYPLESYERAGFAIFKEIAQGKLESAWQWGRVALEDIATKFYQHLIRAQEPMKAIERCKTFVQQWYQFEDPNFSPIEVQPISENQAKVIIKHIYPMQGFEAYVHQVAGTMERLVEMNGAKERKVEITEHNWNSSPPFAVLNISWK